VWFVRGGTLDDPTGVTRTFISTRNSKVRVTLPDEAPAFDVYYDPSQLWPDESLMRLEAISSDRSH
jgi:hypothetical protein